ncbi:alginate lyase [Mucilaginibacter terrenus]|uniref:Alginate lyase n=1 Tax=Mucilaginibacter terrenus TaxID=2482727 RepID=A0A3E2NK43_9SPHI|nr:alginate lyase family protein [Mucilaginibacter terrenus]RFZ81358.1 alginate lyase [Mucilaginibacter terrenus]
MKHKFLLIIPMMLALSGFNQSNDMEDRIAATLRPYILKEAAWAMEQQPATITAQVSDRSTGGVHDFYSEGDYWWPNPADPNGAYIQKDGVTNPDNFVAHRQAMIRFSRVIGALASAYKITHDKKYVLQAVKHLRAWFIDSATLMNPNLQYAQAIKGVATGRGIGIIDTIHLMEVVQGIIAMQPSGLIDKRTTSAIKSWFENYLYWLVNSKYGKDEMNARNNHGTCWVMQVACFARFTGNEALTTFCRKRFKNDLLPNQMAADGSFPLELKRTKPYGYSIFNLDAMATICKILSTRQDNLWLYSTADGKSIKKGIEFLYPFIKDKSSWSFNKDVMYWDNWPVAQPSLVFGAEAYGNAAWLNTWVKLDHDPEVPEIIRNLPARHPLVW